MLGNVVISALGAASGVDGSAVAESLAAEWGRGGVNTGKPRYLETLFLRFLTQCHWH